MLGRVRFITIAKEKHTPTWRIASPGFGDDKNIKCHTDEYGRDVENGTDDVVHKPSPTFILGSSR
jgi:hypothetical protein